MNHLWKIYCGGLHRKFVYTMKIGSPGQVWYITPIHRAGHNGKKNKTFVIGELNDALKCDKENENSLLLQSEMKKDVF